jgi:N-acetylmuramoyl-L-alanine amidase
VPSHQRNGVPRRREKYTPEVVAAFGQYPNGTTIGIELCHPDDSGKFTDATLQSARELSHELCAQFLLTPTEDVWMHYQITGKNCPKWFVEHPQEFNEFKLSIALEG